jgi:hypothetical protein
VYSVQAKLKYSVRRGRKNRKSVFVVDFVGQLFQLGNVFLLFIIITSLLPLGMVIERGGCIRNAI